MNVELRSSSTARSADTSFAVAPGAARFAGPIRERLLEQDANGRSAGLSIEQDVEFSGEGHFVVLADLKDQHGELVAPLKEDLDNAGRTVTRTIALTAPGEWISRHAIDGPYVVSGIQIMREGKAMVTVATEEDHRTAPYKASNFRTPPPPRPAGLLPETGASGGGYRVVVTGEDMWDSTEVLIDGQRVVPRSDDRSTIEFSMPPAPSSALADPSRIRTDAGGGRSLPVDVVVRSPWGEAKVPGGFTYRL